MTDLLLMQLASYRHVLTRKIKYQLHVLIDFVCVRFLHQKIGHTPYGGRAGVSWVREMTRRVCVLGMVLSHVCVAQAHLAFSPSLSPSLLQGRSAPAQSMARAPGLRAGHTSVQDLPKDCGIDPATGEICAGDPSIVIHTNVKMGDKKRTFMAAVSKALASALGKPESFVAVCVNDGCDMMWGGEDTPCALGSLYSLGAINLENNQKVMTEITMLMGKFDVAPNKMYVNFFDVPRENIGYNGATFGG